MVPEVDPDCKGKGVIGLMGSGEGYGVAVEWTWEVVLQEKQWEMGWYGFGGSGYGTGLLHRFKREEWGRGTTSPSTLSLFSFWFSRFFSYKEV
ncbi:hypothetical protein Tco_0471193 [Tanacetum coccineum]